MKFQEGHSSQQWPGSRKRISIVGSGGWDLEGVAVLMAGLSVWRFQTSAVYVDQFVGDLVLHGQSGRFSSGLKNGPTETGYHLADTSSTVQNPVLTTLFPPPNHQRLECPYLQELVANTLDTFASRLSRSQ